MWKAFWLGLAAAIAVMALAHSAPAVQQAAAPRAPCETAWGTPVSGNSDRAAAGGASEKPANQSRQRRVNKSHADPNPRGGDDG